MPEDTKENPFKQPKVSKISPLHVEDINERGGTHLRVHDLDNTPAFKVRDQDNFKKLPQQEPPKTTGKN